MDYNAPFLVLPDYRENLVMELLPGIPASGNISDTSGNGNDAVRTGCTRDKTLANIPVLTFAAGSKLTVSLASMLNIIGGVQTIVAWVKVNTPLSSIGSIWSSYNNVNACNVNLTVRTFGGEDRSWGAFTADEEGENLDVLGGDHIPDDEWVMVVFQIDIGNSNIKFYVYDLSQERILSKNQATNGSPYTLNQDIIIGWEYTESYQFIGSIAMIRQYNVVLTEIQLKNIYQFTRRNIIGVSPKI